MRKQKPSSKKSAKRFQFCQTKNKEKSMTLFVPWAAAQDSQPAAKDKAADSKMSFPICLVGEVEDSPEALAADLILDQQQG